MSSYMKKTFGTMIFTSHIYGNINPNTKIVGSSTI